MEKTAAKNAAKTLPLQAIWKNKRLPLQSALAFSRGGTALHLTFSTHELTCAHLRKAVTKHADEINFDLTLSPLLSADGSEVWSLSSARFGQVTRTGKLGAIALSTYNPSEEVHVTFEHDLVFPPDTLTLKGDVNAVGCGVLPWTKAAAVRRQDGLEVTLAGKSIQVNGVTFERISDEVTKLRLSSEPHPCGSVVGSDVALTIAISGDKATSVRLEGYTMPRTVLGKDFATPLTAKLTRADEAWSVALDGQVDVGGYALTIDGVARAQPCPEN